MSVEEPWKRSYLLRDLILSSLNVEDMFLKMKFPYLLSKRLPYSYRRRRPHHKRVRSDVRPFSDRETINGATMMKARRYSLLAPEAPRRSLPT